MKIIRIHETKIDEINEGAWWTYLYDIRQTEDTLRALIPQITNHHISLASCQLPHSSKNINSWNAQRTISNNFYHTVILISEAMYRLTRNILQWNSKKRASRAKRIEEYTRKNSGHCPPPGVRHIGGKDNPRCERKSGRNREGEGGKSEVVARPISKLAPFSRWPAAIRLPRDIRRERMMVPSSR